MMDEHTPCTCDICKVRRFERNHYYHGKMLSARDLADEQKYFNEKRWLINRAILGWGIVCGLDVSIDQGCLIVEPGLALDCCGHEILVCEPQKLSLEAFARALGDDRPQTGYQPPAQTYPPAQTGYPQAPPTYPPPQTGYPQPPPTYPPPQTGYPQPGPTYPPPQTGYPPAPPPSYPPPQAGRPPGTPPTQTPTPRYPAPQDPAPRPDYPGQTPSSIRWAVCLEYKETRTEPVKPAGSCEHKNGSEYNRVQDDYKLTIRVWDKACPDDHDDVCCTVPGLGSKTSLHHALADRSKKCPRCKECACVVVATGTFDGSAQPPSMALDADSWKYRRLVYTNPALASVIRCFHSGLPHITWINWPPDTQFKVDDFMNRLKDHLQIQFDQTMRARTVTNVRSCRLSIFFPNNDSHCPVQLFIPVHHIEYDEHTRIATYCFDNDCIEQELRKVCRKLRKPADVELVLHGSLIHNEHGRALDAELIDGLPTGNGVEGGEFIASYTVAP
jgi:hypothetical protein